MSFPELKLQALLSRLGRAEVDFVVVGGVAVAFQGYGRATKDLDITYSTDHENLGRLGGVLVALHARLRGVVEDVPFVPDDRTLARTRLLTFRHRRAASTSSPILRAHRRTRRCASVPTA